MITTGIMRCEPLIHFFSCDCRKALKNSILSDNKESDTTPEITWCHGKISTKSSKFWYRLVLITVR